MKEKLSLRERMGISIMLHTGKNMSFEKYNDQEDLGALTLELSSFWDFMVRIISGKDSQVLFDKLIASYES